MGTYFDHQHPAMAATNGVAMHGQAMHSQYHSQDVAPGAHAAALAANNMPNGMQVDDGYLASVGQMNAMYDGADYTAGGFLPLPQAPRLPVAAARASSLAAMYYDPSLHPQHAFSHVTPVPWSTTYHYGGNEFGGALQASSNVPSFQHQHVEQQLMLQNQMTKQQAPFSASTAPMNQGQYIPHQALQVGSQSGYINAPTGPAPHQNAAPAYDVAGHGAPQRMRWDHRWSTGGVGDMRTVQAPFNGARRNTAGSRSQSPGGYIANGGAHALQAGNNDDRFSAAHYSAPTMDGQWSYAPQAGQHWDAHRHDLQPRRQLPFQQQQQDPTVLHATQQAGAWPWNGGQSREVQCPTTASHQATHQPQNAQVFWQQQQQQQQHAAAYAPQMMQGQAMQPLQQQSLLPNYDQQQAHGGARAPPAYLAGLPGAESDAGKADIHTVKGVEGIDADTQQQHSAPAPPSPDTLDKSAVPISSVGAEIIWLAAAALLDPSLWMRNAEASESRRAAKQEPARVRMSSHGSASDMSSVTTPFTSPLSATNEDWARSLDERAGDERASAKNGAVARTSSRFAFDHYEESSASSSEPGTPPTSNRSRIWERHDVRDPSHTKRASLGALHGMRSLGLTSSDDARSAEMVHGRSLSPMDLNSPRTRSSFQRSMSYDRARELVSSVTELLYCDVKWSINDDKLDSLAQPQRRDARSPVNERSEQANRRSSPGNALRSAREENGPSGLAAPSTEPCPAFRRFVHQVLAQTLVSPTAFMLGLMYSLRVLHLAVVGDSPATAHLDPEAVEIFAQPPSAAPFKLMALGLMIANKHLDDNTFLNKTWNEVTGISLPELNRAERWYLEKCSYEVTVPEHSWVSFLEQLRARTDQRVASLSSAKRIRVPFNERPDGPRRSESYVVPHAGSEEAHKRFLIGIEEALHALGRSQAFDLMDVHGARSGHLRSHSPEESLRHKTHDQDNEARLRLARPKLPSTNSHQHCHSAPAINFGPVGPKSGADKRTGDEGLLDVFDDEEGPYRPHSSSIRRVTMHGTSDSSQQMAHLRASSASSAKDTVLNRSISDSFAPSTTSCAHEEKLCGHGGLDIRHTQRGAPLAPSVLLDLLNKGQHFAHAAH